MSDLTWDFPLPRPHCGVPLGNGVQGVLVWGDTDAEPHRLNLTIGRAGFWDRRGGNTFASRTTFATVKRLLQANDEAGLRTTFGLDGHDKLARPHQLGCGRIVIDLKDGFRPVVARIDREDGSVQVELANASGRTERLVVRQAMDRELAWVELPAGANLTVTGRPSYDWVGPLVSKRGVAPPRHERGEHVGGWQQDLPSDQPLALRWKRADGRLSLATALGANAWDRAGATLGADLVPATASAVQWWRTARAGLPQVDLPDAGLQHAWDLGVHRWLTATSPTGVPCTLQGPWLEDYQIPPWSCDYHFNINVQMIYQPGFLLGRGDHFTPLWDLLRSWMPGLRAAGEGFFGAKDAILLPHAVDDRCQVVGAFWTGMIDHACTGWMALLAFEHVRHTGDREVLATVAWPMLVGAHAGFAAMAEDRDGRLSLPVSVSPEFKGARMDAWGRDASFQLACWHAVLRALPTAAALLGKPIDPAWATTASRLPTCSTVRAPRQKDYPEHLVDRIALWEGMDLIESHRHHSHLAGLWPFRTLDPADPAEGRLLKESLWHWIRTGAGAWSGWCIPWASVLCARMGWADGAVAWLHWGQDAFTNVGHGTLHDADFMGVSTLHGDTHIAKAEIYQLDAGCGAITAIGELLMQERGDALHILPAIPRRWRRLSFSDLRAPGGFRIGAEVDGGRTVAVTVVSERGGPMRLAHGLGADATCDGRRIGGPVIEFATEPGQRISLRR
jgi:alpha-L-fucosidase 2